MSSETGNSRPRVLFIGVGQPWIGGAGYLTRQDMWLRALTQFARVDAALFGCPENHKESTYRCTVHSLPIPIEKDLNAIQRLIGDCTSALPQSFRSHAVDECRRIVAALFPEDFDAVFCYRIDFGHFAGVLNHPHLLLDVDDPEHVRKRERLRIVGAGDGIFNPRLELMKLRRFEQRAVANAQAAFVCQQRDLKSFPLGNVHVVPNAVGVPTPMPKRAPTQPRILFIGNLAGSSHSPNVDGIRWFVQTVWPRIRSRAPHAVLQITGTISDELRGELAQELGVCVTGFCDDLAGTFGDAAFSIAPIRFATGTRIKILESMAWGCPVISTTKGAEGLPIKHGREILIADAPDDLANACLRLLADHPLQQKLACAGYELVAGNFSQKQLMPRMVSMLKDLLPREQSRETLRQLTPVQIG